MAERFEGRELLLEMLDEFESGFAALGSGGAVVAWNRALESIAGLSRADALGRRPAELPALAVERGLDGLASFSAAFAVVLDGAPGSRSAYCDRGEDGRRWELRSFMAGGLLCCVADAKRDAARDAEEKLRGLRREVESKEALLRQVLDLVPYMVFARNRGGEFILANNEVAEYYGLPLAEIIGKPLERLHRDPLQLDGQLRDDRHVIDSGETLLIPDERFTRPNGKVLRLETTKIPFDVAGSGEPAVLGVSIDITARLRAEKALSDEKERLAVTLRSIGEGVIATDTLGCITLMNPMAARITGWDEREAMGLHIGQVFKVKSGRNSQALKNPVYEIIHQRRVVQSGIDTFLTKRDGEVREVSERGAPIIDSDGAIIGAVLVFSDISEKRLVEKELEKIQKIESMGLVAGGVAHDFNNILTVVIGNINVAKLSIPETEESWRLLTEAEKAIAQARKLTNQLSSLAKGAAEPVRSPVDLRRLVAEVAEMNVRGGSTELALALEPDMGESAVDATQIAQVAQNLVINARQAMGDSGRIAVSGRNERVGPERMLPLMPGDYVMFEVRDEGPGIPPEILSRIFDPYFTTKSRGSGLGLTIAFSAVKKHGGCIVVDSAPGKGTAFRVYLPRWKPAS